MSLFDLFNIDLQAATAVDFANITPYELGRNVLLPFVLVYIILWAILERLRIFPKRINVILSLGISILLATTPAYTILAVYITQVSGGSMVVIFGILLVGGTLMWAFGRGRDIYYEQVGPTKKLEKLYKRRGNYLKKAREAEYRRDTKKARAYIKMVRNLDDKIDIERGR